jgi:hypothetical protein
MAEAQAAAQYTIPSPETALASDASITHVWLGVEAPGGKEMLPDHAQATVALAYGSGVQVTFVPWVYGIDVPPFSQRANAQSYEIAASQDPSLSVVTVAGVPARILPTSGDGGPGSIEFNLGTSNEDALTIVVMGRLDTPSLQDVAASIISQRNASHV